MRNYLSFLFLFLIFISCGNKNHKELSFNKELYSPSESLGFNIKGNEESETTLISVYNPWQGAENVSSELLILGNSEIPENFQGQILKGKAERIVCMSSTHIAMLDVLGEVDKVVGVSGKQYVSNPYIRQNVERIRDIGYEGNIDYESLLASDPQLVLLFSVNGASSMEPKLKELGIPFLYIGDYVEETPLGKAEWIIPLAEVVGKREKGIEKFNEISHRYEKIQSLLNNDSISRPKVMLNAPFAGSWFMPSTESYVVRMIKDAGADYVYTKNTGNSSLPVDMEEALKLVSDADYWINIGGVGTYDELLNSFPKFTDADCVKRGNVYNNNRRATLNGGNDCYESGVVNPDLILRDMIKIFHPELVNEEFVYYQKLE